MKMRIRVFVWIYAFISLGKVASSGVLESHGRRVFPFTRGCLFSKVVVPFLIPHQQCLSTVLFKQTKEPLFPSSLG